MISGKQAADMLGVSVEEWPEGDFYETPVEATLALIAENIISNSVWECAAGNGAIADEFRKKAYTVYESDINPNFNCMLLDFLSTDDSRTIYSIVTNPPYALADKFVIKAIKKSPQVAMLLRLNYIAGKRRAHLFEPSAGFRCLMPFKGRLPRMHKPGYEGPKQTSMIDFAWYVWDNSWTEPPYVKLLDVR